MICIFRIQEERKVVLKIVTFNSEKGSAEHTAQFIGGFNHVFSFISFWDPLDHQGADTKVICAKIGRITGEVSTVLIPSDLWRWMACNGTAHTALTPSSHHMRLQRDEESRGLVLINSSVFLWSDMNFSWLKKKKTTQSNIQTQILLQVQIEVKEIKELNTCHSALQIARDPTHLWTVIRVSSQIGQNLTSKSETWVSAKLRP